MPEDNERHKPPKSGAGDATDAFARAGLSQLVGAALGPIAGVATGQILNAVVAPPFQRRLHAWMEGVGESLRELEQRELVDLESLRDHDVFVDIAIHATQAALRTAHEEKLEALRNAVENASMSPDADESKRLMFVTLIDSFSEWHLRILDLFQEPSGYISRHPEFGSDIEYNSLGKLIETVFPSIGSDKALYTQYLTDMDMRGLTRIGNPNSMMSGHGIVGKRTTQLGDELLRFIRKPE